MQRVSGCNWEKFGCVAKHDGYFRIGRPAIKELIDYDPFCGIQPAPAEATASQAHPAEVTVHDMKKALDNPSLGIKVIDVREEYTN